MKNPFHKEAPKATQPSDDAAKKEKLVAAAIRTEKFVNIHPYISTAALLGVTHVVVYGALALVTRP